MASDARRPAAMVARIALTVAILAGVAAWVEPRSVLARLANLDPIWFAGALVVSVPQFLLSALRWQLTAGRLDVPLSWRRAVSEYYLAVLGNQVLPGGIVGDAARAYRHGQALSAAHDHRGYGPAVRAVIYERLSGQAMLAVLMVPALMAWPHLYGASAAASAIAATTAIFVMLAVAAIVLLYWSPVSTMPWARSAHRTLREAKHALIAPDVIARQGAYSLGVLATYLGSFYCAGRAAGLDMDLLEVVTLVPVVLFSMVLPFTIGGWGVREATAGTVWALAGLSESDGVAASVAYGLSVLLSALPGVLVLFGVLGKSNFGDKR